MLRSIKMICVSVLLFFFSRHRQKTVPNDCFITIHTSNYASCSCARIFCVESVKYLGAYWDLSWNTHMTHICKKLRSTACMLYNSKVFLPFSVRKILAQTLGYSVLRYGMCCFFNCSATWKNRVNSILKKHSQECSL